MRTRSKLESVNSSKQIALGWQLRCYDYNSRKHDGGDLDDRWIWSDTPLPRVIRKSGMEERWKRCCGRRGRFARWSELRAPRARVEGVRRERWEKLERERTHPCQCHGWKAVPRELRFLARVPTTLTREDPRCRESAHPHSVADEENDAPRHAARRWRAPSRRRRANTPFDRACRTLVPCHPLCEHKFFPRFSPHLHPLIHLTLRRLILGKERSQREVWFLN